MIVQEERALKVVIRVVPQADAAGEVGAQDVLGQLLAELNSLHAFDPGGDGELRYVLDDIRMNSPVTVTIHPTGSDPAASLRTREACRAVTRAVDASRRTGRIPRTTSLSQRKALRGLVDSRRASTSFDTTLRLEEAGQAEQLVISADAKVALRDAFEAEARDPIKVPEHREHGCLVGRLVGVTRPINRTSTLQLDCPAYGGVVRCDVPDALVAELGGDVRLRDVWTNMRVIVTGALDFAVGGGIDRVVVEAIEEAPHPVDLDDVADGEFTAGIPAHEHLERVREGLA